MTMHRPAFGLRQATRHALAFAILIAAAVLAHPALARDVTASERAALERRVTAFDAAMTGGQMDEVIGVLPPRIVAHIAKQARVEEAALRRSIAQQAKAAAAQTKFRSFGMDLARAKAATLREGTPYLMIPTRTVIETGTGAVQTDSETLAMLDGGDWYLLNLGAAQQVAIFTQVYPDFAGVNFPEKTTKAVP